MTFSKRAQYRYLDVGHFRLHKVSAANLVPFAGKKVGFVSINTAYNFLYIFCRPDGADVLKPVCKIA